LAEAIARANAAAGIAVGRSGAAVAMPTLGELEAAGVDHG
jgi:sugar/nucleoside kinase (ribokinase family)